MRDGGDRGDGLQVALQAGGQQVLQREGVPRARLVLAYAARALPGVRAAVARDVQHGVKGQDWACCSSLGARAVRMSKLSAHRN